MIHFDKGDTDVLAICSCGWRHHAAGGSITASMAAANGQAMDHIYRGHATGEAERARAISAHHQRQSRKSRNTP